MNEYHHSHVLKGPFSFFALKPRTSGTFLTNPDIKVVENTMQVIAIAAVASGRV